MNWKKNIGASKISSFVLFLIISFFVLRFLVFEETGPNTHQQVVPEHKKEKKTVPTYASRAIDNSWPTINKDQSGRSMGKSALTENYYIVLDGSGSMEDKKCSGNTSKM